MASKKILTQIEEDFSLLIKNKKILGIFLFGSYLNEMQTNRSDIDICIVAPKEDPASLLSFILQHINVTSNHYDVRIFQTLPLYIKIQIIEKGILIYSPDKYNLYEYLFLYRKLWNDQKHRQQLSKEELLLL